MSQNYNAEKEISREN